jgi:flagellar FliJ protein
MRKSQRLDPLIKIARQRERKLASGLRQSVARCSAHEVRVAQLNTYRTQYRSALSPGQGELSAGQLKELWYFIEKLDEAISQGQRRAAQSREQYRRDHQSFMTARARTKVLEDVLTRYRLEEQKAEVRRENKEDDEIAQKLVANRRFVKGNLCSAKE